jgi:photosystem II stability/assembly factor-like uncharacterized protein
MEKVNKHKIPKKYLIYIFYSLIILVLSSFNFQGSPKSSGWYQQWFPNMNGSTIASLTFLDSLTGYATTSKNSSNQTYILKTTNGGDNWFTIFTYTPSGVNTYLRKVQFANYNTGFVSTNDAGDFFKTTNAGINWIDYSVPVVAYDFSVINADTLLHVNNTGFGPGVYRSTNGGLSWQGISGVGVSNIYMFNKDMGFSLGNYMYKTTNGGVNWFLISGEGYASIKFFDTLKGWKTAGANIISTTSNGGLNWIAQQLPNIHHDYLGTCLSIVNHDTVWMVGNDYYFGFLYKTTNGGNNWGYQFIDSSIHETIGYYIHFVNSKIGWALSSLNLNTIIHTTTGGSDTTFYTGINNITRIPPKNFELKQNYPNPYNNSTLIEYYINESGWVKLKIFDIAGREMATLVNEVQSTGGYGIPVSVQLSSGVYFYKLVYTNKKGEMQMDVKKMVVLK